MSPIIDSVTLARLVRSSVIYRNVAENAIIISILCSSDASHPSHERTALICCLPPIQCLSPPGCSGTIQSCAMEEISSLWHIVPRATAVRKRKIRCAHALKSCPKVLGASRDATRHVSRAGRPSWGLDLSGEGAISSISNARSDTIKYHGTTWFPPPLTGLGNDVRTVFVWKGRLFVPPTWLVSTKCACFLD